MKTIIERLENWGRYQRGGGRVSGGGSMRAKETRSASPYGGQGYQCMTGVICNILASSATGRAGWRETWSSGQKMSSKEIEDAKLITSAYVTLTERQKSILRWCYVQNSPPEYICRQLGIRNWPASHFKRELYAAHDAIEKVLDTSGKRNRIPHDNLIPSLCDERLPAMGASARSDKTESPA